MQSPIKAFISYSWSTPQHEAWVMELATELVSSGVDVKLDKWDLKEGNDSIAFMESMVNDSEIKKVIIVSDKVYAEKANQRSGGVGTESQIISSEVYGKINQNKFVVVIPETDDDGNFYVPTYYKGRIHINLSESEKYQENFDKLIRWIFDKPLYEKPEIGKPPAFIQESTAINLGTTAAHKRLIDSIRNGKPTSIGNLEEYLNIFSENLERFRIPTEESRSNTFHEKVAENINLFLPCTSEYIQTISTISMYQPTIEAAKKIHKFLESIVPYMDRPSNVTSWNGPSFDNFKFIVHEIFLYTLAVFLKNEKFEFAHEFINKKYYIKNVRGNNEMEEYYCFREHMTSFEARGKLLSRYSSRADLLKERAEKIGFDFEQLMQADFILYLRGALRNGGHSMWWPETLIYTSRHYGAFEIFSRASSVDYFEKIKPLLGINDISEIHGFIQSTQKYDIRIPNWGPNTFSPAALLNIDNLAKFN